MQFIYKKKGKKILTFLLGEVYVLRAPSRSQSLSNYKERNELHELYKIFSLIYGVRNEDTTIDHIYSQFPS